MEILQFSKSAANKNFLLRYSLFLIPYLLGPMPSRLMAALHCGIFAALRYASLPYASFFTIASVNESELTPYPFTRMPFRSNFSEEIA